MACRVGCQSGIVRVADEGPTIGLVIPRERHIESRTHSHGRVPALCHERTPLPMISVAALRMQQFGVQFYQASLTARDIDKLVRFEVLNYGEPSSAPGV